MSLVYYLIRTRDGMYYTGEGWSGRIAAKRYAKREDAEKQSFMAFAGSRVAIVKVKVKLK